MAERQRAIQLLDAFDPSQRALLDRLAQPLELPKGRFLLRRGEPGGDVYLLVQGTLEVVDTRATPEVIFSVLDEPGAVVGDLAFLDDSPRAVDVRAATDVVVRRWGRDDLRSVLARNPDLAARFYEAIARIASRRLRGLTEGAATGSLTRREPNQAGVQRALEQARELAERVKTQLLSLDARIRQDSGHQDSVHDLRELLDDLEATLHDLMLEHEVHARDAAAKRLARELHPWLVRSALAERCIRRPQGVTGAAEVLAHVLVDTAAGDGRLGELLDRWLLDRPTLSTLRTFRAPTVQLVRELLPTHRNRRVLLVNAGTGSLVAQLMEGLANQPTLLTVLDQSRGALAFLDASVVEGRDVKLATVQENLARFALGRGRQALPEQDAVVIHGMLEYLPERIAVSLLTVCRGLLRPGGFVVAHALAPSRDHALLDRLLEWPTIRRSEEALVNVFAAAGLQVIRRVPLAAPGLLVAGAGADGPTPVAPLSPSQ